MKFLNLLTDELRRARIFYGLLMISVLLVQAFNIGNMIIRNRQTVREGHPVALYLTDFLIHLVYIRWSLEVQRLL